MRRFKSIGKQLSSPAESNDTNLQDSDVIIIEYATCLSFISAIRTPITKAKKGGLRDALPEDLLSCVLKALIERSPIRPSAVQDIIVGNVLQPGAGATTARMATFYAG
jgi:acetyl-CoA acyltransferase 1